MSNHTSGPWEWNPSHHSVVQPNGDDVLVGPSYKANARLIAAAPDLLSSLMFVVDAAATESGMDIYRAHLEVARAAIAKATGEV